VRDPDKYLADVAARLIRLTEHAYPDPRDRFDMSEPPGITDNDWIGLVTITFCSVYGLTPEFALDTVENNRARILASRQVGADPDDIVRFMWQKLGPPPAHAFNRSHRAEMN